MTGGALGSLFAQLFHLSAGRAQDAPRRRRRGGHVGHLRVADRGDAARRRASPLRVEAAQLHPRRRRRGRGRRRRASRCSAPGPSSRFAPHAPPRRRRPRRRGALLGIAGGLRLRAARRALVYGCEDLFEQAADPLDVVAGDRRPLRRRRRPHRSARPRRRLRDDPRACSPGTLGRRRPPRASPSRRRVVWALALGSGTSGGVLAPLLMMGGALGSLASSAAAARRRRPVGDASGWPR